MESFNSRVTVTKMSKMTQFFAFPAGDSKKLVTIWVKSFISPERSY